MSESRMLSTLNTGHTVINSSKANLVMVQCTTAFKGRVHAFTYHCLSCRKTVICNTTRRHMPQESNQPYCPVSHQKRNESARLHGVTPRKTFICRATRHHIPHDSNLPNYAASYPKRKHSARLHGVK